ncbi:adenylate/guanylate cyclase domain-containing protein [Bacillus thuringiensis]|nr:adenylate/guanylate cyclase domain-containing protein [Bacillus thuringiensis]
MKSNYKKYNFDESLERLDTILSTKNTFDNSYSIPKREDLTYKNGYYVTCSSLFIDLRDSSEFPRFHSRNILAKIYRAYISEVVAVINGSKLCKEINIVGDCVSAIFETTYTDQVYEVFSLAIKLNTLIKVLNYKLKRKGYISIKAGIGLGFGEVLMIRAGYKKISDIVWMGDAVNQASKMCERANKGAIGPIVATKPFYSKLNNQNTSFIMKPWNSCDNYYHTGVIDVKVDEEKETREFREVFNKLG